MKKFEFKINDCFEEQTENKQPGFALSIVKDGKNMFTGCYGFSNLEHDIKITEDTIFYLCSLSKQFTATCLAFLLQEGKLRKNDKLIDYFPSLPEDIYGDIRLSHLIHMCSGIHEWYNMKEFSGAYADEYPWRASIIPLLERQESLSFQPGEKYIYCNTNYALLTLIIEQVTNGSIVDFAAARIFQPLGMNNTFFSNSNSKVIHRLAAGYNCRGENITKTVQLPPLVGAGGVYSSLKDMTIWLKVLMAESWEPEMICSLKEHILFNNGNPNPYLMGLEMGRTENYDYIKHGGSVPGFFTYIRFYPESGAGYVWLQNSHDIKPVVINCQIHGQLVDQGFLKESKPIDSDTNKYDDFTGGYIDLVTGRGKELIVVKGKLTCTNSALTFSNFEGPVFYSNKCIADLVILENYHGLKIMRCIGSDYDQFFLKGDKLPEPDDLSEYTGLFSSRELNITYQIIEAEKWIVIKPVKKFSGTSLKLIAHDIFFSPQEGIKLRFKRNQKGKIDSFFLDSFRSMNYLFRKIK